MSDGQKLKPQHAPKAPHEDPKFMKSVPARPISILGEYLHPLVQLKREGIADTIVMFGSARIESHETAQAHAGQRQHRKIEDRCAGHQGGQQADAYGVATLGKDEAGSRHAGDTCAGNTDELSSRYRHEILPGTLRPMIGFFD